jgi:hypothetical protein
MSNVFSTKIILKFIECELLTNKSFFSKMFNMIKRELQVCWFKRCRIARRQLAMRRGIVLYRG